MSATASATAQVTGPGRGGSTGSHSLRRSLARYLDLRRERRPVYLWSTRGRGNGVQLREGGGSPPETQPRGQLDGRDIPIGVHPGTARDGPPRLPAHGRRVCG